MSSEPSSPGFIDPNARLLASVIPPPPPTLRAKVAGFVTARSPGSLQALVRWSGSREGRSCFFAGLAGVALTLAFYRSESSSAASAVPRPVQSPAAVAASVRSEPLALTPTSSNAATRAAAVSSDVTTATARDAVDDAAEAATPANALAAADMPADDGAESDATAAARPAPRRVASAKSKAKGKRSAKQSRKAKRQSVARASRSGRRTKAQRATSAGPLAAWLSTQRSKDAAASKRR